MGKGEMGRGGARRGSNELLGTAFRGGENSVSIDSSCRDGLSDGAHLCRSWVEC